MESIAIKIKKIMLDESIKQTDLAEKLGMSKANLSSQLLRDSFRIKDIEKIADALGYDAEMNFIKR